MKSIKSIYWTLGILLILFTSSFNWASRQQNPVENKAMENWTKYSTPGQPHQFLAKQKGDWGVAVKMWMQPGAPPNESEWMAHGKMILGGRYLQMQYHGMMMGMHFEAITISAFDNHLKAFITTWLDNMGTGVYQGRGILDDAGKVLTETGEMYDAMMGHNMNMKTVTTHSSNDRFTVVMYHSMPGAKEFKSMEMVFTRTN
jgi:hypothetical protein